MNIKIISLLGCLLFALATCAQKSRFSLQGLYGLNGNFFVRSYDELGGPAGKTYFYKKNFIGSISGIELDYQLNKRSTWELLMQEAAIQELKITEVASMVQISLYRILNYAT